MVLPITIEGLSPGLLPPPKDVQHKLRTPNHLSAYTTIFNFQQSVLEDKDKLIRARVLGFILLLAPTDTVRAEVVRTIVSCASHTGLYELRDMYIEFFIRPFKKNKGPRTAVLSSHHSLSTFDARKKVAKDEMHQVPETHQEVKKRALFRDGYRRLVTKVFDYEYSLRGYHKDYPDTTELERSCCGPTHCAHIIPGAYLKLSGLKNTPHCYETKHLCGPYEVYLRDRSLITTFTTPDPSIPLLPDPALLALHATCAKLAHLSGVGEHIDQVERD
ncbi:hypothetical protein BDP27DRAFT_1426261 [Rhodocollybia butyracea]|uniref:Uncharacterized protein n=1 Tax=Rhodocollybia butyracea TaxID=206335 RepID=A0A9P5PIW7_9AGAR|nr:hypothetical protein BDP27DRAFT_1426261 [Rhodocollybia butyracea]